MSQYDQQTMVLPAHIKVINQQLINFGSKVPEHLVDDNQEHVLANVLHLALGQGTFGNVSLNDIESIGNQEFNLKLI